MRNQGGRVDAHQALGPRARIPIDLTEDLFRSLLESAPDAMVIADADGNIVLVNAQAEKVFGWRREELVEMTIEDLIPARFRGQHVAHRESYADHPRARPMGAGLDLYGLKRDGSEFSVEISLSPLRTSSGVLVSAAIRDITERRNAEAELARVYREREEILETIPDIVYRLDVKGNLVGWNRQLERATGLAAGELKGRPVTAFFPPDDHARIAEAVERGLREGYMQVEASIVRRDGRLVPYQWTGGPIRDSRGQVVGLTGVGRELTERMQAKAAVREAEEKFRNAFENAPIGIALVSPVGRWLKVNAALSRIVGYPMEELVNLTFQELTHPDDLAADLENVNRLLAGEIDSYEMEKRYIHTDGHLVWVLLSVSLARNDRGEPLYFIAQIQDITSRKQTEARLRLSEARLEEAQQLARLGYWEWLAETNEITWSQDLLWLHGFSGQETRLGPDDFFGRVHAEDRQALQAAMTASVEEGHSFSFDYRVVSATGETRWIHLRGAVETGPDGKPTRVHGTIQDVTERRRAEDKLRASLREKESLLQEIHHRVKNNLQIISSLLSIQSEYTPDAAARDLLMDSRNRIRSMAMVHERLYQSKDLGQVDLAEYFNGLAREIVQGHGRRAAKLVLETDLAAVRAGIDTAVSCGLILNELMSNAIKHAFPDDGAGRMVLRLARDGEGRVCFSVMDDGVGLPPKFSLRSTRSMGLQLVTTLVDQLRGEIRVESVGRGAVFEIAFPLAGEPKEPS